MFLKKIYASFVGTAYQIDKFPLTSNSVGAVGIVHNCKQLTGTWTKQTENKVQKSL